MLIRGLVASATALVLGLLFSTPNAGAAGTPRSVITEAILADDSESQAALVTSLAGNPSEDARTLLTAWREGGIHIYTVPEGSTEPPAGTRIPIILDQTVDADGLQAAKRLDTGAVLLDGKGVPLKLTAGDLEAAETDSNLRKAMKSVLDLATLAAPSAAARSNAVTKLGMEQKLSHLAPLRARRDIEPDESIRRAIREAIAIIELKSEEPAEIIAACNELGSTGSMIGRDFIKALLAETQNAEPATRKPGVIEAAEAALVRIETHTRWVNFYGTLFRGLSLGSVLLVVAIGLAITFGLMGVINMAHGELIAVGAYATYMVQNIFGPGIALSPFGKSIWIGGINAGGALYDNYFLVALPVAFLSAAAVGIVLERGIIQFLYRRPLESLLATWGVSLVLQQLFRMVFGANNVQVYSPSWLSGHWTVFDVIVGWNRLFVIGFAILIVFGTWALLTKTPLGLLIRAVMQNRSMAACLGVRTERVNMMTFAFGSGLAGLAGAFLSQIGNVGPSLGQSYIVDAFMTVVVGGVGNLFGTVISALGIGIIDQALQQILLNPVLGKILVLGAIILFLQWKPAGLFVTKSRSLEAN